MLIAATFGLLSSLFVAFTGDGSASDVARDQPMKFAAMEGLYEGGNGVGLITVGLLTPNKTYYNDKDEYVFAIKIPTLLSFLATRDFDGYVPGIKDIINGNPEKNIIPIEERMQKGKIALNALKAYKTSDNNNVKAVALKDFENNYAHFGYGFLPNKDAAIPNVPITFYSFHMMVGLGIYFIMLFSIILFFLLKDDITTKKFWLKLTSWSIPLGFIASELGWVVAEVGRQPWTIQDILPTMASTSHLSTSSVQITFWMFTILFTVLLIAEVKIMLQQIKKGPKAERS